MEGVGKDDQASLESIKNDCQLRRSIFINASEGRDEERGFSSGDYVSFINYSPEKEPVSGVELDE